MLRHRQIRRWRNNRLMALRYWWTLTERIQHSAARSIDSAVNLARRRTRSTERSALPTSLTVGSLFNVALKNNAYLIFCMVFKTKVKLGVKRKLI